MPRTQLKGRSGVEAAGKGENFGSETENSLLLSPGGHLGCRRREITGLGAYNLGVPAWSLRLRMEALKGSLGVQACIYRG